MTRDLAHDVRPRFARVLRDGRRPRTGVALAAILVLAVMGASAPTADAGAPGSGPEPKVPPSRDPGGVPVAMIGPGIDYRAPEIYQRLARDGEGDLIGWDFIDNDLKPFAPDPECPVQMCSTASSRWRENPVRLLLGEAGGSKLIVLRTKDGDRGTLAAAIAFAARSPARIVPTLARGAVASGEPAGPDWRLMIEAARRFSNLLFIVPAYGPAINVAGFDSLPLGNLLIVTPVTPAGTVAVEHAGNPRPDADLAVSVDTTSGTSASASLEDHANRAVARVAAVAARLSAVDPIADALTMKQRILALAQPLPEASKGLARAGWLADPRRHFWLE